MNAVPVLVPCTAGPGQEKWRRSLLREQCAQAGTDRAWGEQSEETAMPTGQARPSSANDCAPDARPWQPPEHHPAGSAWGSARLERVDAKARLAGLARTLESDVIPRLARAHSAAQPGQASVSPRSPFEPDIAALV
jgi:hypothetical protein